MNIVFLLVGIAVGIAVAFLFLKSKGGGELSAANERGNILEKNISDLKSELSSERKRTEEFNAKLSSSEADKKNLEQKLAEQKKELEELNAKFTKEFENLANKILEEKSKKFTEQNKTNIDIVLSPLKEKLKEFEDKVDKSYKTEAAERNSLKGEILSLISLNKQLTEEANNLTNALKGDNKQQGNWGEVVLEKILERSGLKEGEEYKKQFSTNNAEGERIRPDIVVFLPDNKHIIIDSKVSLTAYEQCVNATTEDERLKYLKQHLDSVRGHVKLLSDKNYYSANGIQSPDFVLLFIPIESSFSLAVQGDAELFNFAWDRKTVIVSPSTLFATLRTIASLWKQEKQTRNHLEIAKTGGDLYDKFKGFVDDMVDLGKKIGSSQDAYKDAMNKLVDGRGNVIKQVQKLKELGADATKELPQNILDRAD